MEEGVRGTRKEEKGVGINSKELHKGSKKM